MVFLVAKVWINLAHKFLTSEYSTLIFKKILIYKPGILEMWLNFSKEGKGITLVTDIQAT